MIRLSTGLASAILGNYGLTSMMNYGCIDVYSGDQPEYAHWYPTGVWLGRISQDGGQFIQGSPTNGLELDRSEPGALRNSGRWALRGIANGVAGWWRWKWYLNDPNTTDPYYPRMDGLVGESLMLANTTITPSSDITLEQFYLKFGEI